MSKIIYIIPAGQAKNRTLRKEYTVALSNRIKELRKEKDFTQEELANRAGLHVTYVGHLELGKYHPTVYVMWKISRALGVSMNDLTDL